MPGPGGPGRPGGFHGRGPGGPGGFHGRGPGRPGGFHGRGPGGPGGFHHMGPRPPHRPYRGGCGCFPVMCCFLIAVVGIIFGLIF